jgi:flavodoxin I
MTGNTQLVAEAMRDRISEELQDAKVKLTEVSGIENSEFFNDFDFIFIGSSTWGDGDLNPSGEEFFETIEKENRNLNKKRFSVFGLGETYYPNFCTVVDIIDSKIRDMNGEIFGEHLKIDGYPEEDILEEAGNWAIEILNSVIEND